MRGATFLPTSGWQFPEHIPDKAGNDEALTRHQPRDKFLLRLFVLGWVWPGAGREGTGGVPSVWGCHPCPAFISPTPSAALGAAGWGCWAQHSPAGAELPDTAPGQGEPGWLPCPESLQLTRLWQSQGRAGSATSSDIAGSCYQGSIWNTAVQEVFPLTSALFVFCLLRRVP